MTDFAQTSTQKLIATLWQRNQTQVLERLEVLERAAAEAAASELSPGLVQEAAEIAHKLAGSLGMFGFHEGTRVARELEVYFESPSPDPALLGLLTAQLRSALYPASERTTII